MQIKQSYFTLLPNGNLQLEATETLKKQINACDDEPFATQLAVRNCSGFLVSSDLLVTAGAVWIANQIVKISYGRFDYAEGKMKDSQLSKENVYNCKKILKQTVDQVTMNDYAVIQLDRRLLIVLPLISGRRFCQTW